MMRLAHYLLSIISGLLLCTAITLVAIGLQQAEQLSFAHPYIEALVLAILIGIIVRSSWRMDTKWKPGINFCAKFVLEVAVMLLGASVSFSAIAASGLALLAGIIFTVLLALSASYTIGRLLGLSQNISILYRLWQLDLRKLCDRGCRPRYWRKQ